MEVAVSLFNENNKNQELPYTWVQSVKSLFAPTERAGIKSASISTTIHLC